MSGCLWPAASSGFASLSSLAIRRECPLRLRLSPSRHFRTTACLSASTVNHYEILGLEPSSTQAQVKKRYYQLSKSTHPDRNPGDPEASSRFSAVSDAYATLGNPEKRARYDRDVMRTSGAGGGDSPYNRRGSYSSSHAGPNGSRPASGLSKRRSRYQGPPPSFYETGGYGAYGARAAGAEANAESARRAAGQHYDGGGWSANTNPNTAGGFSPGQGSQPGVNDDVPHFDHGTHYRTHENVMGKTAGRKKKLYREYTESIQASGMGTFPAFVAVSTIVGVAVAIPMWWMSKNARERKRVQG